MEETNALDDRIRQFILSQFPLARQRVIQDCDSLLDNGIIDSMGVLELVNFVESEFGILIADDELLPENFQSVHHLAAFVRAKRAEGTIA
jgi:acyl carrier protein